MGTGVIFGTVENFPWCPVAAQKCTNLLQVLCFTCQSWKPKTIKMVLCLGSRIYFQVPFLAFFFPWGCLAQLSESPLMPRQIVTLSGAQLKKIFVMLFTVLQGEL